MKKVPPCLCSSFGFSEQAAEKVGRSVLDARASRLSHGLRRNWGSPAAPLASVASFGTWD